MSFEVSSQMLFYHPPLQKIKVCSPFKKQAVPLCSCKYTQSRPPQCSIFNPQKALPKSCTRISHHSIQIWYRYCKIQTLCRTSSVPVMISPISVPTRCVFYHLTSSREHVTSSDWMQTLANNFSTWLLQFFSEAAYSHPLGKFSPVYSHIV